MRAAHERDGSGITFSKCAQAIDKMQIMRYTEYNFSEKYFSIIRKDKNMFIGRKEELEQLKKILTMPSASVMIYGKRKVGKTTLIKEALKFSSDKTVYYECIKAPIEENVSGFAAMLARKKIIPPQISFLSFGDVFSYLNTLKELDELYKVLKEI